MDSYFSENLPVGAPQRFPTAGPTQAGISQRAHDQQFSEMKYRHEVLVPQLHSRIRELERELQRSNEEKVEAGRRSVVLANTIQQLCSVPRVPNHRETAGDFGQSDLPAIHLNSDHDNPFGMRDAISAARPNVLHISRDQELGYQPHHLPSRQVGVPSRDPNAAEREVLNTADPANQVKQRFDPARPLQHTDVGHQTLDDVLADDNDDEDAQSSTADVLGNELHVNLGGRTESLKGKGVAVHDAKVQDSSAWDDIEDPELRQGMLALQTARIKQPRPVIHDTGFHFEDLVKRRSEGRGGATSRYEPSSNAPHEQTDLWSDLEEREEFMRACRQNDVQFREIFRYGIRFTPEAPAGYKRAIMISNLPRDTELRTVLHKVRGGAVEKATLLNTGTLLGGNVCAMVVFCCAPDAASYRDYVLQHPITFGPLNQPAEVEIIPTPTYPAPGVRMPGRYAQGGRYAQPKSRALHIECIPAQHTRATLIADISCGNVWRAEGITEAYYDDLSILHLEFSSIDLAGSARAILMSYDRYAGLFVSFADDPCDQPLETLQDPPPTHRSYIPKLAHRGDATPARDSVASPPAHAPLASVSSPMVSLLEQPSAGQAEEADEKGLKGVWKDTFQTDGFRHAPQGLSASQFATLEVKRAAAEATSAEVEDEQPGLGRSVNPEEIVLSDGEEE
ncbi:hypothetical protein PVAG01_10957 [Phlyctema vagabunda]|uniref:Uncharacterized protein n=1 Tax=Phlyctema vagabunda TaxID=108571 RepID=A0ABR4P3Q1_9HELO